MTRPRKDRSSFDDPFGFTPDQVKRSKPKDKPQPRAVGSEPQPLSVPTLDANGWPIQVPIIIAEDLTWSYSNVAQHKHDISVWLTNTFQPDETLRTSAVYNQAYDMLRVVLNERLAGYGVESLYLFLERAENNQFPSLAWQAACWNEMLARLGYQVPAARRRDPGLEKT